MKKALSVLLVAAALFGFYGSAVTVNDLLACKDYWEEAGEKSTADMNKLEDGLNQLKDNEQAYLDGVQQVADGEVALADGEAQYAQGVADYAAAPAKLADAEEQLAEGRKSLDKLSKAIKGIDTIVNGYTRKSEKSPGWKQGYEAVKAGRPTLAGMIGASTDSLGLLAYGLDAEDRAAYISAMTAIATDENGQGIKDYEDFMNNAKDLNAAVDNIKTLSAQKATTAGTIYANCVTETGVEESPYAPKVAGLVALAQNSGDQDFLKTNSDLIAVAVKSQGGEPTGQEAAQFKGALSGLGAALQTLQNPEATAEEIENAQTIVGGVVKGIVSIAGVLSNISSNANAESGSVAMLQAGIKTLTDGYDGLVENQQAIADGIQEIASGVMSNSTLKKAAKKKLGAKTVAGLAVYASDSTPLSAENGATFAAFVGQMETNPDMISLLKKAKNLLAETKKEGVKTYNKGMNQYKAGLQSYREAPAKLADAEQQLADGRKQLEDGKAQLAQYEDGEQQIRDGLATLFNTEADLDLVSIADRLNGDGDFDNGDNHLEIEEGLNAVEVGRGYQAEDGVLITKEIMGRAVATGGLLAAAVLAVLAAILSFLNKNKGAGVFAILAAAAGAFGAFYGPAQGTYFSEIAGSTIGTTTWVAAGVLGAVALVHAIAHFAAKKAA